MENINIELATREDIDHIVALRQACMPHVVTTRELIEWQFFDHPAGSARVYVIRSPDEIVSMYTAVQQNIRIGNTVRKGRMVQDVMTLPDYRGRGYLHQQGFRCWQDMTETEEIGYTFPNQHSENSFRRTGWQELSRVPLRILMVSKSIPKPPAHTYRVVKKFTSQATDIWQQSSLPIGVHRDAAYLNWRYSKPDSLYSRFMINEDKGVLVLKLFNDGRKCVAHICDLFVIDSHQTIVEDALLFSNEFARKHNAGSLTCWLPEKHHYERAFDTIGFEKEHLDRFVFVKPALPSDHLVTESPWHFSQGDSDVY